MEREMGNWGFVPWMKMSFNFENRFTCHTAHTCFVGAPPPQTTMNTADSVSYVSIGHA